MATTKLPPPSLSGTVAPFYADELKGTVILTVPFVMNKIVSLYEVSGISLKIKDAETNTPYGTLECTSWTQEVDNPEATFSLGATNNNNSVARNLIVGKYYKIQLAYIDTSNNPGYYSTIAITKFTAKPIISILNMNRYMTNNDMTQYTGQYVNLNDSSEKAYQYKFDFRNFAGELLESSGWRIHNANTNTEIGVSTDTYNLLYSVQPDEKYTMQYSVITNNGLQISSPRYQIVGTTSIAPELSADLMADLDYDNGCVNLRLKQSYIKVINPETGERENPKLSGSFILSRASSVEKFTVWTRLYTFHLTGQLPEGVIFSDYTCEHGQTYRYAIQQFNVNGIFSSRMLAEVFEQNEDGDLEGTGITDIVVNYEDMFLYDGKRQLRIRFNPKVSSFKTVLQESKKTTLGSQFPFFFRSGLTEYKEFPISGLISYMIDDNEFFLSRTEDLLMPANWDDNTDITDENMIYERRFKLEVLDWLNNGEIKLFRSPAEGNYLVRLMGVQLSPNDSVSRMIHTFQCTATEVDSYTPDKLQSYGFLTAEPEIPKQLRFGTINLDEYIEIMILKAEQSYGASASTTQTALDQFANYDILKGFGCQYLHFEDFDPKVKFTLGGDEYIIGATGNYEAVFETAPKVLKIVNPTRHMSGTITYGVLTTQSNSFDTVTSISHRDVLDVVDWSQHLGNNYIASHNDVKHKMNKIYFMNFYINDMVYEFGTLAEFQERYHIYMKSQHDEWYNGGPEITTPTQTSNQYYTVFMDGVIAEDDVAYEYLTQYYHLEFDHKGSNGKNYYSYHYINRGAADLYIDNTIIRINSTGDIYKYHLSENGKFATLTKIGQETDALGRYKVYMDDQEMDISLTGYLHMPPSDAVPTTLKWGSEVRAEICYQELIIDYGVENGFVPLLDWGSISMQDMRQVVELSNKYYQARELNLQPYTVGGELYDTIRRVSAEDDQAYFSWNGQNFHRLTAEERTAIVQGAEIWKCFTHWEYNSGTRKYVYNANKTNNTAYNSAGYVGSLRIAAELYNSQKAQYMRMVEQLLEEEEKELVLSDE